MNSILITFIITFIVIETVTAAPPQDQDVQILRYENDNGRSDGYAFSYETSDGTSRQEQGQLKDAGSENPILEIRGTVTWVADDGQTYSYTYLADENGYQPQGVHLPSK